MGGVAGCVALNTDGYGGCGFVAGSTVIPAVGSVLGADYNSRDHAVIAGYSVHRFLAAIHRNGAWSVSWCDCGESLRAARACIRYLRVHPRAALRRGAFGSKRISIRGRYAGHCAVGAANGFCMANCLSSLRRSDRRTWGGADIGMGVAGEGRDTIGEKVNSFFHSLGLDGLNYSET